MNPYTSSTGIDELDRPVQRDQFSHPYSYDGFVTHRAGPNSEATGTVYSDRLMQWDWKKYNVLSKKHFGNEGQNFYLTDRTPAKIEAFLRDYNDNPKLKLVLIMQYCNQSSGYPVWRFDYNDGN